MTSRERLIATLNHREPDRVAVDLGSTSITGININALVKLRRGLGPRGARADHGHRQDKENCRRDIP